MANDVTKQCSRCAEVKPLSGFGRKRAARDGLQSHCKECQSIENRQRYAMNAEDRRERRRSYYQENAEAQREARRNYHQEHREEENEASRGRAAQWRLANPGRAREAVRRSYEANRDKYLGRMRRRAAQRKALVLAHYGEECACCGTTARLSIDHIDGGGGAHRRELYGDPRKGGGQFIDWLISNGFPSGYQILCVPCNTSKGERERCSLNHGSKPSPQ
jgi:hypothetical protein